MLKFFLDIAMEMTRRVHKFPPATVVEPYLEALVLR